MITTPEEYFAKVQNFERDRLRKYIDSIPGNINRSGKHFKKLIKQYEKAH